MAEKKIKNDLASDYRLIGIASSLKEYRLCYFLNLLLDCDFRKLDSLAFEPKDRTRTTHFSVFKAGNEEDKNSFVVFTNKNLGDFLLPEVNNFDYIIQVTGKYSNEQTKHLAEGIRQFPEVVMSAEIPVKKIKSKERLVYEEVKEIQKRLPQKRFK